MKKSLLFLLVVAASLLAAAQKPVTLKKIIELPMSGENGSNGASVVWHPIQKKYYASFAGNEIFPFGVFDVKGKKLSADEQEALFDVRGLWYNANTKTIQVNGYNEYGWGEYTLDKKGIPTNVSTLHEGLNQPGDHSSGCFNAAKKEVYFFNSDGNVDVYDYTTATYKSEIKLDLKFRQEAFVDTATHETDASSVLEYYNTTTLIYTGITGAEFGVMNYLEKQVELYNAKTGKLSKIFKLPEDAVVPSILNFAYANGIYWVFDKDERTWLGYK